MRKIPAALVTPARIYFRIRRRVYLLRYRNLSIGAGAMILGKLEIRGKTKVEVGPGVRILGHVRISGGGNVQIGEDTRLNGCWIIASTRVRIGKLCRIADCGITDNDYHNLHPKDRHKTATPKTRAPIAIDDNVWIGLRAIILKGTSIGRDSVVGAGSVVKGAVPVGVVVAGNPATVIKRFDYDKCDYDGFELS